MRHGQRYRPLPGRDIGEKRQHLRNIVSALLHHEMILTTQARAIYTARMAEKMITKGKRGTNTQAIKAKGFFLKPHWQPPRTFSNYKENRSEDSLGLWQAPKTDPPYRPIGYPEISPMDPPGSFPRPKSLMSKVFITLAERYKDRNGGFTRILKYGRRRGDQAPMAVVCLVNGPRDMKFEMMARIVGKQAVVEQNKRRPVEVEVEQSEEASTSGTTGEKEVEKAPAYEGNGMRLLEGGLNEWMDLLPIKTKREIKNLFLGRGEEDKLDFERKARDFADTVVAQEQGVEGVRKLNPNLAGLNYSEQRRSKAPWQGYQPKAGERLSGMDVNLSGLQIARGILRKGTVMGKSKRKPLQPIVPQFVKKAGAVKIASAASL